MKERKKWRKERKNRKKERKDRKQLGQYSGLLTATSPVHRATQRKTSKARMQQPRRCLIQGKLFFKLERSKTFFNIVTLLFHY